MLQQVVQGHECMGQVRVRGWSISFSPQLQLLQELLFPGQDGAAQSLPGGEKPSRPRAALLGLGIHLLERGEEQGSGLLTFRKAIKMKGEERIYWS